MHHSYVHDEIDQETYQYYIDNVFIDTKETEEERLEQYGRCKECNEINTGDIKWCRTCNAGHFRNDFEKWTSGNKKIDYFIQNTQIHACNYHLVLEWYPWSTFSEIEEIGKGGYGTVFRAKRQVGRIEYWDHQSNQWSRWFRNEHVALKTMGDSESKDFMNEVTNLRLLY